MRDFFHAAMETKNLNDMQSAPWRSRKASDMSKSKSGA
jgi:hypothetical protein